MKTKILTGTKATLTMNGIKIGYADNVTYHLPPIEVQRLFFVLSRLGIVSARLPIPLGVEDA